MSLNAHTVADRYCSLHGITTEQYLDHIRGKVLYPHARFLLPFILLWKRDYLAADDDFIRDVGRITHYSEFAHAVMEYFHHSANTGMLREKYSVRVSSERMRRLVKELLGMIPTVDPDGRKTRTPFGADIEEAPDSATPRQRI